jgi:endonuclease YncB( thermonuclease family)
MRKIVILLSLLTFVYVSWAQDHLVLRVIDGDTVTLEKDGKIKTVRFDGIDCPEKSQPYGPEAAALITGLIGDHRVNVIENQIGKYGRTIGVIEVGGLNLNEALVSAGLAWVYDAYCKGRTCDDLRQLQAQAQKGRVGLWADPDPLAPWDWRRGKGRKASAPGVFHGNVKSRIFHKSGCRYFNCKSCTEGFETRQQAIDAGYRPCGVCDS